MLLWFGLLVLAFVQVFFIFDGERREYRDDFGNADVHPERWA